MLVSLWKLRRLGRGEESAPHFIFSVSLWPPASTDNKSASFSSLSWFRCSEKPTPTCPSSLQRSPGVQRDSSRVVRRREELATVGAGGVTILEFAGARAGREVESSRLFAIDRSMFEERVLNESEEKGEDEKSKEEGSRKRRQGSRWAPFFSSPPFPPAFDSSS